MKRVRSTSSRMVSNWLQSSKSRNKPFTNDSVPSSAAHVLQFVLLVVTQSLLSEELEGL